jgi:predicted phosphodiesterase
MRICVWNFKNKRKIKRVRKHLGGKKMAEKRTEKRTVRALTPKEEGFVTAILQQHPVLSDADVAHKMLEAGLGTDLALKDLRNKVRYARRKNENPNERTRVVTHKDGSLTVSRWQQNTNEENQKKFLDEKLIEELNLDPENFQLSSYAESEWENAEGDTLHATRKKFTRIRNKETSAENAALAVKRSILLGCYGNDATAMNAEVNANNIDAALASIYGQYHNQISVSKGEKYSLILPLPDLHIGEGDAYKMYLSYKGTFEKMVLPEIKEKYFGSETPLVNTIDIACLGDIVHCDNNNGTTTAGTTLNPATDVFTSYQWASEFLDWLIGTLRKEFEVPVRFIYVYGNHDTNVGFYVTHLLQTKYRDVEGVDFLVNENIYNVPEEDDWFYHAENNPEILWVQYGNVGITYTHGKFIKKNGGQMPDVANPQARKDVDYNAVIYGHLHHLNTTTAGVNQHNFGLSTPNFVRDKYGKSLGCVTDSEFYLFEVNHMTNRINFTQFPSLPYNKQ